MSNLGKALISALKEAKKKGLENIDKKTLAKIAKELEGMK